MPHYADGTEAKVGDIVQGKGYNVKNKNTGELVDLVGMVLGITPGSASCNLQIQYFKSVAALPQNVQVGEIFDVAPGVVRGFDNTTKQHTGGKTALEYGQADHFKKIGEVLTVTV